MQSRNKQYAITLIIGIVLFTSCQGNLYREFHKFDNYTWKRFDKVRFEIPITQEGNTGDIIVSVRHLELIPLDELPLNIIITSPEGEERIMEKTIKLKNEDNEFIGDVAGSYWDIEEVIWLDYTFNSTGTYVLEIENLYPKIQIPAIVDIGIKIKNK